jgi:hypothetical protein
LMFHYTEFMSIIIVIILFAEKVCETML